MNIEVGLCVYPAIAASSPSLKLSMYSPIMSTSIILVALSEISVMYVERTQEFRKSF
jgi:hypothetical protein